MLTICCNVIIYIDICYLLYYHILIIITYCIAYNYTELRNRVHRPKEYQISGGRRVEVPVMTPPHIYDADIEIETETDILSHMKDNELHQELELREKTITDRNKELLQNKLRISAFLIPSQHQHQFLMQKMNQIQLFQSKIQIELNSLIHDKDTINLANQDNNSNYSNSHSNRNSHSHSKLVLKSRYSKQKNTLTVASPLFKFI